MPISFALYKFHSHNTIFTNSHRIHFQDYQEPFFYSANSSFDDDVTLTVRNSSFSITNNHSSGSFPLIDNIISKNENDVNKSKLIAGDGSKDFVSFHGDEYTIIAASNHHKKNYMYTRVTDLQLRIENMLLWAANGIGMIVGTLPLACLLQLIGGRKFFSVMLFLSGISTFTLIFAVSLSSRYKKYFIIGIRLIQGITCAGIFPLIGTLSANWSSLKEQFIFLVWGNLFIQAAPLISWPVVSIMLIQHRRLPYFICGGLNILYAFVWFVFYRDRPQYHPWVNGLELNKIVAGKVKVIRNRFSANHPFASLAKSTSVWAIWVSSFGYYSIIALVTQFLPIYYHSVIKESISDSIFLASSSFIFMFFFTIFHSLCQRFYYLCHDKTSVLVANSVSFLVCSMMCIFLALFLPANNDSLSIACCFSALLSFLTLSIYGFYRSAILVGRFYGQYIIANMQIFVGFSYCFVSMAAMFIIRNNDNFEWRLLFILMALILLLTAATFGIFGSGDVEEWAKDSWDPSAARRMINFDQIDYNNDECGLIEMRLLKR